MIEQEEQTVLVHAIEQHLGRALLPQVREAFLHVPRHLFVQQYYQQVGNRLLWHLVPASHEQIDQDEALVTQVDAHGMPSSSTSQPSAMAVQLELLHLEFSQHVLEIGSGTGYNVALLALLVGVQGHVVSIDINEHLVEEAQQHLARLGLEQVNVLVGDGFAGEGTFAPYDRLLATCSFRAIPHLWFEQLKPGGRMVGNWITPLTSLFVILEKTETATLAGTLVDLDTRYMEMRQPDTIVFKLKVDWVKVEHLPVTHIPIPGVKTLLHNPTFGLLLWCSLPHIRKRYRGSHGRLDLYLLVQETVILVEEHELVVFGDEHIGHSVQERIEQYNQLGRPSLLTYQVIFSPNKGTIHIGDHTFTFLNEREINT